tara:strand:- start:654 stop:893 length:240 start_codon:yes stop_codon:yes gene_type:complete
MSTIKANIIDSTTTSTDFKEKISTNGDPQWLDTYGVIKTNRDTIAEDITIPLGTNGLSSGPVTISGGYTVTVRGEWAIV